jgi:hypothetical protein
MAILSPNMFLYLPTIGVFSGITWEMDVNANSNIIDGHNHSVGSGVQINPNGININTDLAFNDNNAITLRSTRFSIQPSPISLPADLGCLYVSGFDLYFNDENGNQIQITKGGNVNATSSGISDGTATASFVGNTLVVDAASNTPANIQGASILLGNTGVSGSFYVTLSPPSALASSYSLTLPALPPQTNVMTLTPAGTMSSISYDQVGIDMTFVGANAIAETVTRATGSSTEGLLGVPQSASSGNFILNTGSTFVAVTNLSVTLTTSGRPVQVMLMPDGIGTAEVGCATTSPGTAILAFIRINRDAGGALYSNEMGFEGASGNLQYYVPAASVAAVDIVTAGTHTYIIEINGGSSLAICSNCVLVAYEL